LNANCETGSNDEHDDPKKSQDDPVECHDNNSQEETEDDMDGNPQSVVFQSLNPLEFKFREDQPGTAANVEQLFSLFDIVANGC